MCFNRLGDFTCIDTPCPVSFKRNEKNGFCVKQCPPGSNCSNRPISAIEYKTIGKMGKNRLLLTVFSSSKGHSSRRGSDTFDGADSRRWQASWYTVLYFEGCAPKAYTIFYQVWEKLPIQAFILFYGSKVILDGSHVTDLFSFVGRPFNPALQPR